MFQSSWCQYMSVHTLERIKFSIWRLLAVHCRLNSLYIKQNGSCSRSTMPNKWIWQADLTHHSTAHASILSISRTNQWTFIKLYSCFWLKFLYQYDTETTQICRPCWWTPRTTSPMTWWWLPRSNSLLIPINIMTSWYDFDMILMCWQCIGTSSTTSWATW